MRSTESDSREWYVEKLWIVPALALLLPLAGYVLMVSQLVSASIMFSLLINLVVGIVVLLIILVWRINGVADLKEHGIPLAILLALADIMVGMFLIYLIAVSR